MLQEYLHRTFFVCLHAALLFIYLILWIRAYAQLRRERAALGYLTKDWDEDGTISSAGQLDLENLKTDVEEAPRTMLRGQLRAILRASPTAENLDPQRLLAQLGRTLSGSDDLIRFCINGLVIVGLGGTLYAFYSMWNTSGTVDLTNANSKTYFENMSTALLVSLVGLMLALITNFFFALLRGQRQAFLKEVAVFLTPIAGLVPTDAKTHQLITSLLSPLNELIVQLKVQNNEVLRGLTDAVNTRTEQLNHVIDKSVVHWETAIGAFRTETLAAVTNLQGATDRLTSSSTVVANTMSEVSQALERTKYIGRIVDQLDASSGQVITNISRQLTTATEDWIAVHNLATKAYQAALEEQSQTVASATREMTGTISSDLNQFLGHAISEFDRLKEDVVQRLITLNEQTTVALAGLSGKFADSQENISAKWMTEASAMSDYVKTNLEEIVVGWENNLVRAQQNINTTFAGSQDLVTEVTKNVTVLSEDIQTLTLLAHRMSEISGVPVYLGEAVERLGQMTKAVEVLSAKLEYGQTLSQLRVAVNESEKELLKVGRQVEELATSQHKKFGALQEGSSGLSTQIDALDGRFKVLDKKLETVHSEVVQLSRSTPRSSAPKPLPIPETSWQKLRHRVGRMFKRNNATANFSDGNSASDENTSTKEKSQ